MLFVSLNRAPPCRGCRAHSRVPMCPPTTRHLENVYEAQCDEDADLICATTAEQCLTSYGVRTCACPLNITMQHCMPDRMCHIQCAQQCQAPRACGAPCEGGAEATCASSRSGQTRSCRPPRSRRIWQCSARQEIAEDRLRLVSRNSLYRNGPTCK